MNTLRISVRIDRKAALLAGRVLNERETIEVSPDIIGDQWPALVGMLDMSADPPSVDFAVDDTTPEAVRSALEKRAMEQAESLRREEEQEREYIENSTREAEAAELAAQQPMTSVTLTVGPKMERSEIGMSGYSFAGFKRDVPTAKAYTYGKPVDSPRHALAARVDAAVAQSKAEVDAANEAALAVAMPDLLRQKAEKEAKDAEAAAAKKAATAAKFAERLRTGTWELETGSYNECRYGAWWVAKVDFSSGPKGDYTFGESTGKWGKSGTMSIDCQPGDFIAYGQKDLRRPGNSDHTILRMRTDGSMEDMGDKAAAYKGWKEAQKTASN